MGNKAIATFIFCRFHKLGMTAEITNFTDQAVVKGNDVRVCKARVDALSQLEYR